jgi:N-succinyldiaminopimelate aminotransferase
MNPGLSQLRPYPFERLRELLHGVTAPAHLGAINLSIGEPKHATPALIHQALTQALGGLAQYPATKGSDALRQTMAAWISQRYQLPTLDPDTQLLPVNGSREALFSFVQACINPHDKALVVVPNPGYQIYEGAALLAGAQLRYLATTAGNQWRMPWNDLSADDWARVKLVFVCSPGNPSGHVMSLAEWQELFALSDRHGFIIAADECYSELYTPGHPPLGSLQAAHQLGRSTFPRLLSFSSLSKRSNVPGLRSGYVAGDATLMSSFFAYRTYHGSAMGPAIQAASIAAWNDETHVDDNRAAYQAKFDHMHPALQDILPCQRPTASFYLWARTPGADTDYVRHVYEQTNVLMLPGSFLGRTVNGFNPGEGHVRLALVAPLAEIREATRRLRALHGLPPL